MTRYTPPQQLDAVGLEALTLYDAGGGALSESDVLRLQGELEKRFGDFTALYDAVHSVCAVMLFAEQQGKKQAAERLTQVIRHAKPWFAAWNQRVKESIGDEAASASRRMTRLLGEDGARKAPALGASRPTGTVSLASLRPPMGPMVR